MSDNGRDKPTDVEPKWRQDFPIEWSIDNYVARREFTKFLVLASGVICLGDGIAALARRQPGGTSLPATAIAVVDEIAPGQVKQFRYPTQNDPAILVRARDGNYSAFQQRCTHLSCPVQFSAERERLECPCHDGAFDCVTGHVLQGPPPRPLTKIALRIENGQIMAAGLEDQA